MSQVHYWELSNYNNGELLGKWFDLDGVSEGEHAAERQAWLEELTEETGELCEEWILGDTEDVPSAYVHEYGIDSEYFQMQEAASSSHLDAEVFLAGASLGIPAESIEDAYYGHFDSDTDLAYEYEEATGMLADVPDSIKNYFDYEAFGRDLALDFLEEDGHYFHGSW